MPRLALLLLLAALPARAADVSEPAPASEVELTWDGTRLSYDGPDATLWLADDNADLTISSDGKTLSLVWTFNRAATITLAVYQSDAGIDVVGSVEMPGGMRVGMDCCSHFSGWAELLNSGDWLARDARASLAGCGAVEGK